MFSSKRLHGTFTRLFISYVDSSGKAHKPFVMPQKDPRSYESCLLTFNTAELVTAPLRLTGEALAKVFREHNEVPLSIPITMATPSSTRSSTAFEWEYQRE